MTKEKVNEYKKKLKERYEKMTPEQKIITAGIGGLFIGFTFGALLMNRR